MRIPISIFFVTILFMTSLAFGFVPFAPGADIPANPNNDPDLSQAISYIKKASILEDTEVGLPAYPGAQVVQTEDGHGKILPMVRLITPDVAADVISYYKRHMTGWEYGDHEGGSIFWQGEKKAAIQGEIPTIRVGEAQLFQGIPSAQTEISIWYTP